MWRGLGLRAQLVIALFAMLVLAYVPLLLAIDGVVKGTAQRAEGERARTATTWLLAALDGETPDAARRRLERSLGTSHLEGAALYGPNGAIAEAGLAPPFRAADAPPAAILDHGARRVVTSAARNGLVLVAIYSSSNQGDPSPATARLIALYTGLLAVLLLALAYHQLTRLIVRPVDTLARGAERVATGARLMEVPETGAAELVALGRSLESMTNTLLANEDALKNKVTELTRARAELAASERLASVGRLAAGVAHEVGNPVAAILGMHELVDDLEIPAEDRKDFLLRMKKETERVANIVRDLLDFARPEGRETLGLGGGDSGRFEAPARVRAVVDDALQLARVQRGWKDIVVVVEIPDELVFPIRADRLKQVFLNLLMNAGAALADTKMPTLSVRGTLSERDATIVIEDNGAGVPEELQGRIFEPFVTTKDVGEGTGLGLAVCRGLVEDAGGKLGFEPGPNGVGARFSIRFSSRGAPTPSRS